jgi:hypothetical protein
MLDGEIEPKSRKGRRKVPVPAVLRDHLDALIDDGPLFGSPRWIAKTNERARERWAAAGLPALTLHEARHTYASQMIAAGVNAKTLSTFMGHATIAVTLDLYGHLLPGSEDEAASMLDSYLAREIGASTVAETSRRKQTSCNRPLSPRRTTSRSCRKRARKAEHKPRQRRRDRWTAHGRPAARGWLGQTAAGAQ